MARKKRDTRKLSERHPHTAFKPQHLPPGKQGRTWNAWRRCSRCTSRYAHPLVPGWRVGADEHGEQTWICPGCASPDDPDVNGVTQLDAAPAAPAPVERPNRRKGPWD